MKNIGIEVFRLGRWVQRSPKQSQRFISQTAHSSSQAVQQQPILHPSSQAAQHSSSRDAQQSSNPAAQHSSSRDAQQSSSQAAQHSNSQATQHSRSQPVHYFNRDVFTTLNPSCYDALEHYSTLDPRPLSISKFLDAKMCPGHEQFEFLRAEMPVRLANMFMELQHIPEQLMRQDGFQKILQQYLQSFIDMLEYEHVENNTSNREKFLESLLKIRERHVDTVPTMAAAVQNSRDAKINQKFVNYFLDRLYTNRISIHRLISHYNKLHTSQSETRLVGTFDPECDVIKIVNEAFEDAEFFCKREYIDSPELEVKTPIGETIIPYVPVHLHHILFEVLKNAMRASCEMAQKKKISEIDPVVVETVRNRNELTIKISDLGGGMSHKNANKVFDYAFTTGSGVTKDRNVLVPGAGGLESAAHPMHGLGYGLPLSRVYARYFQGDIALSSMDGLGTSVYIYLRVLSRNATERLPIYGPTYKLKMETKGSKKALDWTSDR